MSFCAKAKSPFQMQSHEADTFSQKNVLIDAKSIVVGDRTASSNNGRSVAACDSAMISSLTGVSLFVPTRPRGSQRQRSYVCAQGGNIQRILGERLC